MMLDAGAGFVDVCSTITFGQTPLLHLCASGYSTKENLELLIRRGAKVDERDEFGSTCLHHCLASLVPRNWKTLRPEILFLVQQGADPRAMNAAGLSVSDFANQQNTEGRVAFGGARGDVWDSVLAECGYDLREFRRGHPRGAL